MRTKFNIGQRVTITNNAFYLRGTGKSGLIERITIQPNKKIYYQFYVRNKRTSYELEEDNLK